MRYTFTHNDEKQPATRVELSLEAVCLEELLASFRNFLQGCGFEIQGTLIVDPFESPEN